MKTKTEKILVILSISILITVGVFYYLVRADILPIRPTAGEATLSLSPSSGKYDVGSTFKVDIVVDTGNKEIDGVDIFHLNYSPSLLEVQDADAGTPGVQVSKGTIFDMYFGNSVDANQGSITLAGIVAPGGTPYNGTGTVASINFKVLKEGIGSVDFDYNFGATNDCNVAEHGTGVDLLGGVVNGTYTLGNPTAAPTVDLKGDNRDGPVTVDYGTEMTLSWSVTDATSCVASGDWSGDKPTSGSQLTGELTSSKTYTLTCTGPGGSASDSFIVNVRSIDEPTEEPGGEPGLIDNIISAIKAAPTGVSVAVYLIIVAVILAILSIIYLQKKSAKPTEPNIPPPTKK